ncbi:MAG: hypothetical protein CL609_09325 [Anaerolineaceae bacterium]|nr:hypothetical protein [Anaerolineaceae bacterium]
MKKIHLISIIAIMVMLLVAVSPVAAQLGDTDKSSFTVQNVSDATANSVLVTFVKGDGTEITPTELNSGKPNPFSLDPGESWEIYVPGVPGLDSGQYSVVVSADQKIVAIANLVGEGSKYFNGSYSGFDTGATTFYLPAITYNYYGWYSFISVQNIGANATDISVALKCENGTTGTLSATNVAGGSSVHFDLENLIPTGFTAATSCNGSAVVTSTIEDIIAVDNQTVPTQGNTQSYSGSISGASTLYVPALYNSYYGWAASLNIRKLDAGNTTVTVTYSDTGLSTCNLTDAQPGCLLYMPSVHPGTGYFGATITTSPAMNIVAVANAATTNGQAQTYSAINPTEATNKVGAPSVMKSYYGWDSSFTCQNVGSDATSLHIEYDGYAGNAYNTATLTTGKTLEIYVPSETFLPNGFQGGLTVTANTSTAKISCIVNFTNPNQIRTTVGDWSMSVNSFSQ